MKKLIASALASAAMLGTAGVAHAQDWQGLYVGGHVGYGYQNNDDGETITFDTDLDGNFGDTVNTTAPANAFSPGFCDGRARGPTPASGCDDNGDAVDYGVRLGHDWQFGNFVVGALGEVSGNAVEDSVSAFSTTPARYTMTRELDHMAAIRARGGYAFSNMLVYATGGYAWAEVDHSFTTSNGVNTFTESEEGDAQGYQYGLGAEWAIAPRWRVGAEYLRTNLEDDDYRVRAQGPAPVTNPFILVNANGTDFARSNDEFEFDSVRFTLSYQLGG